MISATWILDKKNTGITDREMKNTNMSLKKSLGLPSLTFYGVGMILGAGIYSLIGTAAVLTGTSLWFTFLLAAICAGLTAHSYAELTLMKPQVGAEYIYAKAAWPKHSGLSKTIGLIMVSAGIAASATVALAFGGYLNSFLGVSSAGAATALIVITTLINCLGIRESSRFNILLTLFELAGLCYFIYLGFSIDSITAVITQPISPNVLQGTALIIFAYFGFENLVNLVEEAKTPSLIPKAIITSLIIAAMLYISVSFSFIHLAPSSLQTNTEAPLIEGLKNTFPRSTVFLGICALFSTANTVLISILSTSRLIYGMANDGFFSSIFSKINQKSQIPWLATIFVGFMAIIFMPLGNLEIAAGTSSLATLIGFFTVNVVVLVLRYRQPIKRFSFFATSGALSSVILIFQFSKIVYIVATLFILFLFALQWVMEKVKTTATHKFL